MTLPASSTISLAQIQAEFGGSYTLSQYYRGGGLVPNTIANAKIPASGPIKFTDFYGGSSASSPWTYRYTPPSGFIYSIIFNHAQFVATSSGTGSLYTSPDGINWTQRTNPTGQTMFSVAGNGSGTYVAVGTSVGVISTDDGVTWTNIAAFPGSNAGRKITFGGGYYVILGTSAGNVYYSTNGTTWTSTSNFNAVGGFLYGIDYANTTYFATGDLSSGRIYTATTPTGVWTPRTSGVSQLLYQTVYGTGGHYVIIGNSGVMLDSTTLTSWSSFGPIASGVTASYGIYDGSRWLYTGNDGNVYYFSTVGGAVTKSTTLLTGNPSIAYGAGVYVVAGTSIGTTTVP